MSVAVGVAVILAAGTGRRLGGVAKAVLRLRDGRTYLEAVRDAARAGGIRALVVVVGPPHASITRDDADRLGLPIATNRDPTRGMASSVAVGFRWALDHADDHRFGLLWPVDHPLVSPTTVQTIIAHASVDGVAIPTYEGRGGHPSAFGRTLWPALCACASAARGARTVIDELCAAPGGRERLARVAVADRGVVADVDTPEQRATIEVRSR